MSTTRSLSARLRSRDLGTYTWAQLQAAYPNGGGALAALPAGVTAFVSDWGAQFVRNAAGTRWVPIGGACRLAAAAGSVASPLATFTGAAFGQFTIPGGNPTIPADLLAAGWQMRLTATMYRTSASGTGACIWAVGTAGTIADAALVSSTMAATNPLTMPIYALGAVRTSTVLSRSGHTNRSTDALAAAINAADSSSNFNTASAMQLSAGLDSANAADTYALIRYSLELIAPV